MGLKNTAMKFFMAEEVEERSYEAPRLGINLLVLFFDTFSDGRFVVTGFEQVKRKGLMRGMMNRQKRICNICHW